MSHDPRSNSLLDEISRRKVVRAGAFYLVAAWIIVQVADIVFEAFGIPESTLQIVLVALTAGFPVAIALAWVFDLTSAGLRRTDAEAQASTRGRRIDVAILGVVAVAVAALLYGQLGTSGSAELSDATLPDVRAVDVAPLAPSVAVLPFANFSTDPDNEIFADGLAEDLINRLASISELRVPARTSSFRYRDSSATDVREIGRALNVATILEGSVQAAGNTIKVTANLIDVGEGFQVWTQSYTRRMTDVFAIQEEIAQAVAEQLKIELLGAAAAETIERRPTDSVDAYRFYLQGRNAWHQRTSTSLETAVALFQQALQLDPDFAEAWSGLADAYNFLSDYGNMPKNESIEKATAAAEKALALDPDLAEAHASMGLIYSDLLRYEDAGQAFARAIELKPNFAMAHMWLGSMLVWVDKDAALRERKVAAELDPLSPIAVQLYGESLMQSGRMDEARAQFIKVTEFAPEYPGVYVSLVSVAMHENDYVAVVRYLHEANDRDPGRASTLAMIGDVYLLLGDMDTSREWLQKALELGPDQVRVNVSEVQRLLAEGDYAAARAVLDDKLRPANNISMTNGFLSTIRYQQGRYAETAELIQQTFDSVTALQPSFEEGLFISEKTMYGALYLASALERSGDASRGTDIARQILRFLDELAETTALDQDQLYVQAAARLIVGSRTRALATLRDMADAGYPGYIKIEQDKIFDPLRGEVDFQLAMERMRANAASTLEQLRQLET